MRGTLLASMLPTKEPKEDSKSEGDLMSLNSPAQSTYASSEARALAEASEIVAPVAADSVLPFAAWLDVELEKLEEQFRGFCTRDSLVNSLGR